MLSLLFLWCFLVLIRATCRCVRNESAPWYTATTTFHEMITGSSSGPSRNVARQLASKQALPVLVQATEDAAVLGKDEPCGCGAEMREEQAAVKARLKAAEERSEEEDSVLTGEVAVEDESHIAAEEEAEAEDDEMAIDAAASLEGESGCCRRAAKGAG